MNARAPARCYAIRRVNPFLGVLQIIETDDGRASSANGVVWDIEPTSIVDEENLGLAYYRYGLWSLEEGLINRPLAPDFDNSALDLQAARLIECVRHQLDHLPFALADHHELWLFDQLDEQPIALLASLAPGQTMPTPEPRRWTSCLGMQGVAGQHRFPASKGLDALVTARAGFNINKHWIIRQADDDGLIKDRNTLIEARVPPPFLLSENWPDPAQLRLVRQFIEWTAPSLLTLQHLSRRQRERLEAHLHQQARSVEHHWRLYPQIINQDQLTRARVQCRLHNAQ